MTQTSKAKIVILHLLSLGLIMFLCFSTSYTPQSGQTRPTPSETFVPHTVYQATSVSGKYVIEIVTQPRNLEKVLIHDKDEVIEYKYSDWNVSAEFVLDEKYVFVRCCMAGGDLWDFRQDRIIHLLPPNSAPHGSFKVYAVILSSNEQWAAANMCDDPTNWSWGCHYIALVNLKSGESTLVDHYYFYG